MLISNKSYKAFDIRLCACLDKFQLSVDTWLTENADVTSVLNKNRLQNLSGDSEQIEACLTRVGTLGIWDLSEKTSRGNQDNMKSAKSVTTVHPTKHMGDTQAVKYYLNTIANTEITTQSIEDTGDTQVVKYYLNIVTNRKENNEDQKNLERMALQGNTEAQFSLGDLYEKGIGVQKNEIEATKWYRKAAEQGHADAQERLGSMCYNDKEEAFKWYREAAKQGHAEAQERLGLMYAVEASRYPEQASKWYRKAFKWYREAAEQGEAEAQYELGFMYEFGRGVPEDKQQASKWYRKAFKWYREAAEQGEAEAQYKLGSMYEFGKGVPEDKQQASKWYRKAAEQGHTRAKRTKNELRLMEEGD